LREEPGLNLLGDFDFLGGAALGFDLQSKSSPLCFDAAREFVEPGKSEAVSVRIFKTGMNAAPHRDLRRISEFHASRLPLLILAVDVFRNKPDARLWPYEFFRVVLGLKQSEAQVRVAIRRADLDPALAVLETVINYHPEAQLIDIESQTAVKIANIDDREVQAEIGIFAVKPQSRSINTKRDFVASHGPRL